MGALWKVQIHMAEGILYTFEKKEDVLYHTTDERTSPWIMLILMLSLIAGALTCTHAEGYSVDVGLYMKSAINLGEAKT